MPLDKSPDAVLARLDVPTTVAEMTERILSVYRKATPADIESGARWYSKQGELAAIWSVQCDYTFEQCVAVIAHLSPRCQWARNVLAAEALLFRGEHLTGIMRAPFERAVKGMNSDNPVDTFGGPKTKAFFRNICGDDSVVTVDVWAAKVAGITEKELGRAGVYEAVSLCYKNAAMSVGLSFPTMQATTWIVQRGGRAD